MTKILDLGQLTAANASSRAVCFVMKPLEVLLCREALAALGIDARDTIWFVPFEDRPAINAAIKTLEKADLTYERCPEIRVRTGRLRRARESQRYRGAKKWASAVGRREEAKGQGFSHAIASHNISAWVAAKELGCTAWIVIDSSQSTREAGYLNAYQLSGLRGIFEISNRRKKGLSPALTEKTIKQNEAKVVFFTAYGDSDASNPSAFVVRNYMNALAADYSTLPVNNEAILVVGKKGAPLDQELYGSILEAAPGTRLIIYKPHPRDTSPVEDLIRIRDPKSDLVRISIAEPLSAIEELPLILGFLPGRIVGQRSSTGLDLIAQAARGRVAVGLYSEA
jgi:hypothetical protein